jgi:hypothetical protein
MLHSHQPDSRARCRIGTYGIGSTTSIYQRHPTHCSMQLSHSRFCCLARIRPGVHQEIEREELWRWTDVLLVLFQTVPSRDHWPGTEKITNQTTTDPGNDTTHPRFFKIDKGDETLQRAMRGIRTCDGEIQMNERENEDFISVVYLERQSVSAEMIRQRDLPC